MAAIAASTVLLWVLFDQVEQYGDVTSVYYRTDARAAALLIGAALAMVWRPGSDQTSAPLRSGLRWAIDVVGVVALGLVILMQYVFTDRVIEWASYTRLYHGGFPRTLRRNRDRHWCRIGTWIADSVGLLATLCCAGSATRSYGLYLWHWPVYQLTRPRVDVDIDGYTLLFVRLGVTIGLVELSYRLIESPIRQRRFTAPMFAAARTPRGIILGSVAALGLIMATTAVAVAIPTIDRTGSAVEITADAPEVQNYRPGSTNQRWQRPSHQSLNQRQHQRQP